MNKIINGRNIYIWLNSLSISNRTMNKLLENFDNITDIWYCKSSYIYSVKGVRKTIKDRVVDNRTISYLENYLEEIDKNNVKVITILDCEYPDKLKDIYDAPNVLYYKGSFKKDDSASLAIVGSRKTTDYGKWACEKFTSELVSLGVITISGLAIGIDSIVHKTTIDNGGRTIAVLGNGLDNIYPKKNEGLSNIIQNKGLIISEFPIGTPPLAYNFPQRNRIISGLSDGVIVIEAQEKSGSLITAHHGLEQGKNVFAVPGNINSIFSKGTNKLIRDGAVPLLELSDIFYEIEELKHINNNKVKREKTYLDFNENELKIIKVLENGPRHADELVYKLNIDIASINTILIGLELKNIIEKTSSGLFMLV